MSSEDIRAALDEARRAMDKAAVAMINHGGLYEVHGMELKGAANMLRNWIGEIDKRSATGERDAQ